MCNSAMALFRITQRYELQHTQNILFFQSETCDSVAVASLRIESLYRLYSAWLCMFSSPVSSVKGSGSVILEDLCRRPTTVTVKDFALFFFRFVWPECASTWYPASLRMAMTIFCHFCGNFGRARVTKSLHSPKRTTKNPTILKQIRTTAKSRHAWADLECNSKIYSM